MTHPASKIGPAAFIRTRLPIVEVPRLPGLRLHRAEPSSGLRRLSDVTGAAGRTPYWAFFWPGGLALAHYLRDHPQSVAGRRVLDLGAGSGLVGIAAAKAGAASVVAAEIDPDGRTALRLNAALNAAEIAIVAGDLTTGPAPAADVVLVGDLFYDRDLARRVTGFLGRCRAAGCDVLIGDPGRAFLPAARLRRLAAYAVAEVGGCRPSAEGTVFAFENVGKFRNRREQ